MSIKKGNKIIAGAPLEPVWGTVSGDIQDQADLQQALSEKAGKVSPIFTGTPIAPTAPTDTRNNQIATTKFVQEAIEGAGSDLPDQYGHAGQFLTTDGTLVSWATVDALPSQSGQSGKFLTTNGTRASWETIDLNSKVDKTTSASKVYGTDGSGNQTTYSVVAAATQYTIPYRNAGGVINVGTPIADSHATTKKYVDDGLAAKLDKITYEWNKAISFGSTGSLCIGKFCCYDSNITVDIDATTSTTYHGTLVIATQNIGTASGGLLVSKVYGDATNTITPNIHIYKHPTGDCMIEVYFTPLPWSKNLIHIRAITLNKDHGSVSYDSVYSDICTTVSSVPAEATIIPDNALDSKQTTLVSGTNIKTINNTTILGSGNIDTHELPSQSGNNGKFLTTDGTNASWATVDALPTQAGNNGKFLTTDGTNASWASLPTYSSGTGITVSGTTINHSNSVTAGTAGTSSATSGSTLAVPYITYDAQGHITASGTHTHTITGFLTQNDVTSTYSDTGTAPLNGKAVKSAIDSAISSVYKPAGSIAFANRPSLSKTIEGNVYNITDNFTTTSDFVEGAGKSYPAGTNIVCINTATSGTAVYKWDVLAGMVDLSNYQTLITSTNKLNADLVDDSSSTNKFVTSSEKTSWNNKVDITGDTMTGNLQIQGAGLYLTSIGSSVAESTSRLNLGTPGNVYSYLTGNSQGAFGIYSEKSGTRTGIACYPGQNFFADATTKTIDLGRSNNVWKTGYIANLSDGTSSISLSALIAKQDAITDLATIRSGAAAGATALQSGDDISELNNDAGYITGITSSDVTSALGYTPYDSSNPAGYTSNVGTVTSVNNVQPVNGNVTLSIPTDISGNTVNGAPLSNTSSYFFGTSTSAATDVEKVVSIPSITSLNAGQFIIVLPTITSSVANATLKLNNFAAYPMRYQNSAITTSTDAYTWTANTPSVFVFDGNYWRFVCQGYRQVYSSMSVAEGTTGTATSGRVLRADYLKQIIQGTTLTGIDTSTSGTVVATDTITEGIGKLEASKQATLVSGTNIKTINNQSILGSGNIDIQGGTSVEAYTAAEVQTIWDSVVPNS